MNSGSFKNNVTCKSDTLDMYKQDLALNNQEGFVCRKTQPITNSKVRRVGGFLGGLVGWLGFMAYQPL